MQSKHITSIEYWEERENDGEGSVQVSECQA